MSLTISDSAYRVLWKVLMVAPNGLPQWVSVRAPSEAAALQTMTQARPAWRIVRVERERSP